MATGVITQLGLKDLVFDVVLIGNRVNSRTSFKTMPGARLRARLVRRLTKRYGSRFAVFGKGWAGGSLPLRVHAPSMSSWTCISNRRSPVGASNPWGPPVFSNRLPIAFAMGIPIA